LPARETLFARTVELAVPVRYDPEQKMQFPFSTVPGNISIPIRHVIFCGHYA
jgi:hypothetical protein